jgi:hypothetical protein
MRGRKLKQESGAAGRWEKDLKRWRANTKAKNLRVTPAAERRYLAWLEKIEKDQARDATQAAKHATKLLDSLRTRMGGN